VLSILIDSSSSHSFLNASMLHKVDCVVTTAACMKVKVANGQVVLSDREVKGFSWWIQGHTFQQDVRILELAAYNLILGMDWLELYNPMTCDWLHKWIQFDYNGTRITLRGILRAVTSTIQEILAEQMHKLAKGNDIWALVAVTSMIEDESKQEQYLIKGIPPFKN
jgi:hypothetical protein